MVWRCRVDQTWNADNLTNCSTCGNPKGTLPPAQQPTGPAGPPVALAPRRVRLARWVRRKGTSAKKTAREGVRQGTWSGGEGTSGSLWTLVIGTILSIFSGFLLSIWVEPLNGLIMGLGGISLTLGAFVRNDIAKQSAKFIGMVIVAIAVFPISIFLSIIPILIGYFSIQAEEEFNVGTAFKSLLGLALGVMIFVAFTSTARFSAIPFSMALGFSMVVAGLFMLNFDPNFKKEGS